MFAGGGLFVPVTRELSWCTLGELEGVTIIIKEEVPTISACQMTLIFCSIQVVHKATALYMEWSIDHSLNHCEMLITTMFLVQCVMSQQELHR